MKLILIIFLIFSNLIFGDSKDIAKASAKTTLTFRKPSGIIIINPNSNQISSWFSLDHGKVSSHQTSSSIAETNLVIASGYGENNKALSLPKGTKVSLSLSSKDNKLKKKNDTSKFIYHELSGKIKGSSDILLKLSDDNISSDKDISLSKSSTLDLNFKSVVKPSEITKLETGKYTNHSYLSISISIQ